LVAKLLQGYPVRFSATEGSVIDALFDKKNHAPVLPH